MAWSVPPALRLRLPVWKAMKKGGNAMDAAVATAAALTVCEPTANGIGSDAFALIWVEKEKKLYGLNASGFSPRNISIDALKAQGHETMPTYGWAPTMVPALRLPGPLWPTASALCP